MSRTLWEDENVAAVAPGSGDDARKAVFPAIGANLWMSHTRSEEAWTTDTAGS